MYCTEWRKKPNSVISYRCLQRAVYELAWVCLTVTDTHVDCVTLIFDPKLCTSFSCYRQLWLSISFLAHGALHNSAFTLGHMSLDKSLHMQLKTLLATLFSGNVHTSHMWSDLSSDMRWRMWTMCPRMCPCFSMKPFTLRHMTTHIYARTGTMPDTQTLSAYVSPSAFTLGHMCADKSLDALSDLRPSVKAL